ncbi:MAG: hypothetical protein AAGF95_33710 [Chloroflexota bacterium]
MQCPHCAANLLYRERGGRRCSKCKQKFAFEPKTSPLKLHDLRFRRVVEKTSANGTVWYTPSQLHHALGRKVTVEKKSGCGPISCLSLIVAGGIIAFASLQSEVVLILATMVCAVLVVGSTIIERKRPPRTKLPMPPHDFSPRVLDEWYKTYNVVPHGLITSEHPANTSAYIPPPAQLTAVLACPERDILLCLRANGVSQQYGLGLLPTEGPFTQDEEAFLTTLRSRPDLPLFLLHDASLAGVLLRQTVGMSLGLRAEHRIVDLGLRPDHVLKYNLMRLGEKPSSELLSILTRRMNTTTGANTSLSVVEFEWLKKGYYSPILAVNPARLLRVVYNTMNKQIQQSQRSKSVNPEQQAQQKAQAVGFMSWLE